MRKMTRKRALGPLDQRKKVIRCESCAGRKIKCVGGIPCESCVRTGKSCQKRSSEPPKPVFVLYKENRGIVIPAQPTTDTKTLHLDYFFSFLRRNYLVHRTDALVKILLPLVDASSLLNSTVSAIGALDASRHGSCSSYAKVESPRLLAFKSYSRSVESLRAALLDSKVSQRDDVLWATFFLGLFELMADSSGDGWAKHMLHGTSRLLQAAGPKQTISLSRKAFLKLFRIFEANRAILYGEGTILSSIDWAAIFPMDDHGRKDDWNSLGRVSSVMVQISAFNTRFYEYIPTVASFDIFDPILEQFGFEAAMIQNEISILHAEITNTGLEKSQRLQFHQTLLYYETMSLFLFNTFDYYHCWHLDLSPYLSAWEISHHIGRICQRAEVILNTPGGSGVLLIFPLRVAGTRAKTNIQKAKVLALLDRIFKCGFIVAHRIRDDLQQLWDWEARSESSSEVVK